MLPASCVQGMLLGKEEGRDDTAVAEQLLADADRKQRDADIAVKSARGEQQSKLAAIEQDRRDIQDRRAEVERRSRALAAAQQLHTAAEGSLAKHQEEVEICR